LPDSASTSEKQDGLPLQERFFGVQWRLLSSHVKVALGAAALSALLVGGAALRDAGPGAVVLWGALAVLGALVLGAAVGLRLSRGLKLRLREVGRFASALARGEYGSRIQPGQPDEIGLLEQELNAMAESLEEAIGGLRSLAERNRRLAEEAGRLAALEERTRLARDLHDTVNQQVFSLSMQAAAARRRLEGADGDPARVSEVAAALADIEALARSAHKQMRDLILELRPTTLAQHGLGPALKDYLQTFAHREGIECETRLDFFGRFDPRAEEALFRIAQEALNNVVKHAEAEKVTVSLELQAPHDVVLTVSDDGRGFDPSAAVRPTALGLNGLRERAESVGASLVVRSAPGRGTTVRASFPLTGVGEGEETTAGGQGEEAGR